MSKGRNLTYWEDPVPEGKLAAGLFVKFDKWIFVGIYEIEKLAEIVHRDYANYPAGTVKIVPLSLY
jgi:hypothetical protein